MLTDCMADHQPLLNYIIQHLTAAPSRSTSLLGVYTVTALDCSQDGHSTNLDGFNISGHVGLANANRRLRTDCSIAVKLNRQNTNIQANHRVYNYDHQ